MQVIFFIPSDGALGRVVSAMKFCPKCGSMLLPEKRGKKLVLRCPECGYEEVVKSSETKEYRLEVKATGSKVKTTSVVSEESTTKRSEEELEQEKEEFYEVFLEIMSSEEGS